MKKFFDAFSETFSRFSDKTALVSSGVSLTYAEIQTRAAQIAAALHAQGVATGQIVPILLPHGVEPILAALGVWQVGAAVCIMNDSYPPDRIQSIRQDCGTDFLIDPAWLQAAYSNGKNIPPADVPVADVQPYDLAIVVFTSGSTGKPKGVMLPYHIVTTLPRNLREIFQVDDVLLCAGSLTFVAAVSAVFVPLAHGMTVHIIDEATRKDMTLLVDYVRKNGITAASIAPAMIPAFLQKVEGQIRALYTGSERVRNIHNAKTRCYNTYGASETGSAVSFFEIDRPYANTPIGRPMPGTRFYLLDENDQLVKPGEKGEICISGQIALGYLNRPELTAERFIPNPFAEGEDDKILFRSNDIGRLLPDGAFEYIERKDWMVKVHGNRVEPGEIEQVMLESAPLEKAVVVGFFDKSGEQKLYGCYIAKEPVAPSLIRELLMRKLPEYMVPALLEQVLSLPTNANGKIDRTQIAPPDIAKFQAEYVAPTNEKERLLCNAFAEALGVPQVGIHDDFVNLGGDSVTAVEIQLLLPKTMQISGAVFTALRTPKLIAEKGVTESIPIADDRKEWKVTYDEQWFLKNQLRSPHVAGSVIHIAFSLTGDLDVENLDRAIRRLLLKHRVFRSVYHQDSAGNFIRTLAEIPVVVLEHIRCEKGKVQEVMQERNTPYDISQGPLYRFFLYEIGIGQYILHSSIFHAINDGPGMQILWGDLADLYSGKTGESSEPVADFLDFAQWRETNPKYASDQEYYNQMFVDGFKINTMPWRVPLMEPMPCDGAARSHFEAALLEKGARHHGVPLFTTLISALGLAMGKYCQSHDIVLSLVMNTRFANAALKETAGMLADRFPIRLQWRQDQSLSDFLKTTDGLLTEMLHHQACSGRKWMKESSSEIDPDLTPVMNLNYRRREVFSPSFQGLQVELYPILFSGAPPNVQSMLGIFDHNEASLDVSFLYPSHYFTTESAEGMNEDFARILRRIAEGTDVVLAEL